MTPSVRISLALLILTCMNALAGNRVLAQDSLKAIEQQILAQPEGDISVLAKSRRALLQAIQNRDIATAKNILHYIDYRFDRRRIVPLYPGEEILAAYWTKEYDRIFARVSDDMHGREEAPERLYPQNDLMFDNLRLEADGARGELMSGVEASGLTPEKRDFLELLFDDVMGPADDSAESRASFQSALNRKADEFLANHRDSEFSPYVREKIRYVIASSPWGWGYEVGAGYLALPSSINQYMKDFGLLTLSVEGAYNQAYGCLRFDIGAANHLKRGFTYNGDWNDDLQVMHISALLAGGEMIPLGNSLTVTPTVGIGVLDFSPPEEVRNQEGNDVSLTLAVLAFGVNCDIPLGGDHASPFLRLNIGYREAMTNNPIARGGYTFITLSIDFFSRIQMRDY